MEMQTNELKKAAEFGTPLYVFHEEELQETTRRFQNTLGKVAGLCYAMKANPFLVKVMEPIVDRIEVCSMGEFAICEEQGVAPEKILVSGVLKKAEKLNAVLDKYGNSCMYTAESLQQFELLKNWSAEHRQEISVFPRLTSGNQFGMDENVLIQTIRMSRSNEWVEVEGIQFFSGTQKTSVKKLRRELTYVDAFIQRLETEEGFRVKELEFGPGLPVFYFQGDDFDEVSFLAEFSEMLSEMTSQVKLTFELGRSIAASCGTYMTSVVDAKVNKKQNYAIVDGGIHQLVYYGQSMAMKHPYCHVLPEKQEGETMDWNLFGSLCTVNDILVKQMPVRNLTVGDVIVFENTGAYSTTEGIALFLSRDLPKILLRKEDGEIHVLRDSIDTDPLNTPNYHE